MLITRFKTVENTTYYIWNEKTEQQTEVPRNWDKNDPIFRGGKEKKTT